MSLKIRTAGPSDVSLIREFIEDLADFEKLNSEVLVTEDRLLETLFGDQPAAYCLLAEWENKPAGFALYFFNYSTFLGKPGLYLEDLYVRTEFRGFGIGKSLLKHLAAFAKSKGCGRFEWSVLDWNKSAIDFYLKLGAKPLSEWTVFRLDEDGINALGYK